MFFATNLLSAISYLIAAPIAARSGLINTMVFTRLPAKRLPDDRAIRPRSRPRGGMLLVRSLLSQMDEPTRTSYFMAVVTPEERPGDEQRVDP